MLFHLHKPRVKVKYCKIVQWHKSILNNPADPFDSIADAAMESQLSVPSSDTTITATTTSARKKGRHQQLFIRSVITVFCCSCYFMQLLFNCKSISLIGSVEAVPVPPSSSSYYPSWSPHSRPTTPPETITAVKMVKVNLSIFRIVSGMENKCSWKIKSINKFSPVGLYAALWLLGRVQQRHWSFV